MILLTNMFVLCCVFVYKQVDLVIVYSAGRGNGRDLRQDARWQNHHLQHEGVRYDQKRQGENPRKGRHPSRSLPYGVLDLRRQTVEGRKHTQRLGAEI